MKITNKNLLFIFAIIFFMISCSSATKKVSDEKISSPQEEIKESQIIDSSKIVPQKSEVKEILPEKKTVEEIIVPQKIESFSSYKIKKGDYLYKIALAYSSPIWAIADYNGIKNPNIISENETLKIKDDWNDFIQNSNKKYYRIEIGEILFDIAKKLNIDINSLTLKNNISNINMIYAGKKLLLP